MRLKQEPLLLYKVEDLLCRGHVIMKEKIIETQYSENTLYRYQIAEREDGNFRVWMEKWFSGDNSNYCLSVWSDTENIVHITDSIERAKSIGNELLKDLSRK